MPRESTCDRCGKPTPGLTLCDSCSALMTAVPRETFPRGPSNEQTLLTELGRCKAERDAANAEIDELGRVLKIVASERDALQKFKDWVHAYLDTHGVPHHPPGPHGAEGCRIGDRLDWLMQYLEDFKIDAHNHLLLLGSASAERDALAVTAEGLSAERDDWKARCEAAEFNCSVAQKGWQQTLDDLMKVVNGFKTAQEQIKRLRESLEECAETVAYECGERDKIAEKARAILKETAPPA